MLLCVWMRVRADAQSYAVREVGDACTLVCVHARVVFKRVRVRTCERICVRVCACVRACTSSSRACSAEPNRIIYELAKSQCPVKLDVLGFNIISAPLINLRDLSSAGRAGGFARNEISLWASARFASALLARALDARATLIRVQSAVCCRSRLCCYVLGILLPLWRTLRRDRFWNTRRLRERSITALKSGIL
ncbi:hypothetical protein EVAR_69017_1 [Eumeta japonica]|uniref:Uncharacterized protein n=1 Tax=Eumeta variegata TaxID=151549 RepID=A0A4C1SNZ5_EUMVA|nr:hypothetical protein EVAR_69017_1 [Eumeta japonica]